MCCDDETAPPAVAEMLAGYRALCARHGYDRGDDREGVLAKALHAMLGWCAPDRVMAARSAVWGMKDPGARAQDIIETVLNALPDDLPPGLALVQNDEIRLRTPVPLGITRRPFPYQVFTLGDAKTPLTVADTNVGADNPNLQRGGVPYQPWSW